MIGSILRGIVSTPWARAVLCYAAIALTIVLLLLSIRRIGERVGRIAKRLENTEKANEIQRRMLEAAARRPRDRGELVDRLRDGGLCSERRGGMSAGHGIQPRVSGEGCRGTRFAAERIGCHRDDGRLCGDAGSVAGLLIEAIPEKACGIQIADVITSRSPPIQACQPCPSVGTPVPIHDQAPPGQAAGENSSQPGGLRTGSPPFPQPYLIRPTVRRLLRAPRLSGPGPHSSPCVPSRDDQLSA